MAVFELKNPTLSIKINSLGAELTSVYSLSNQIEYIWQADKNIWPRHAPNLFPIVGKLKNNSYTYQNQSYELSQHGFARDMEFNCIKQSDVELKFELKHNETTLRNFPFQFVFQITYTIENENINVTYEVFNPDNKNLYFSVGAHPAFNCPLQNTESFNEYELNFGDKTKLSINELSNGLISSKTKSLPLTKNSLAISKELFVNDALVFTNKQIDEVTLISKKTKHAVVLKCYNWPFFGIWTKPNTNQFVCLEPWHGIADTEDCEGELSKKIGIIKLEAGQKFNCSYDMSFK